MIRALTIVLVLVLARAVGVAEPARDPAKDRAALTQFEAAYQPIAKLSGAARTTQACQDAAKLAAAGSAFSSDTPPADSPVDDQAWSHVAGGLVGSLDQLVKVCKAPDHKLNLLGDIETADEVVQRLDGHVATVLNAARPRTLPPGLDRARAAFAAIRASSRSLCSQLPRFIAALNQSRKPPAGVDVAAWKEPYQTAKNIAEDLRPAACSKHRAADEQIGSALEDLHDQFYKLVLLVPPR